MEARPTLSFRHRRSGPFPTAPPRHPSAERGAYQLALHGGGAPWPRADARSPCARRHARARHGERAPLQSSRRPVRCPAFTRAWRHPRTPASGVRAAQASARRGGGWGGGVNATRWCSGAWRPRGTEGHAGIHRGDTRGYARVYGASTAHSASHFPSCLISPLAWPTFHL